MGQNWRCLAFGKLWSQHQAIQSNGTATTQPKGNCCLTVVQYNRGLPPHRMRLSLSKNRCVLYLILR